MLYEVYDQVLNFRHAMANYRNFFKISVVLLLENPHLHRFVDIGRFISEIYIYTYIYIDIYVVLLIYLFMCLPISHCFIPIILYDLKPDNINPDFVSCFQR